MFFLATRDVAMFQLLYQNSQKPGNQKDYFLQVRIRREAYSLQAAASPGGVAAFPLEFSF